MAANAGIPILDCSVVGLRVKDEDLNDENIKAFGQELTSALRSAGLCYLRNFGIDKAVFDGYMEASRRFFTLPVDVKQSIAFSKTQRRMGWTAANTESHNPEGPKDLKEAFNYHPAHDNIQWPEVEGFKKHSQLVYANCTSLARRLFDSLSAGLGLRTDYMATAHDGLGTTRNNSYLRMNYYHPIDDLSSLQPGQIRLGEHSDYGTFSILLQDDNGGLEAELPGKGFVPVTPIPDTLLLNAGDLLQRWTSDTITAARHRVANPDTDTIQRTSRQSCVLFVEPDREWLVKPLDGSDKYAPVTSEEYLSQKLNAIY